MSQPDDQHPPRDNPAAPDQAVGGGPVVHGPLVAGRDNNIANEQTIIYTAAEHQRRLDDYLALLSKLAKEKGVQDAQPIEQVSAEKRACRALRMEMARAALHWKLPPTVPGESIDDLTWRSLVAALLLPLVLRPTLVLAPPARRALASLSSRSVVSLVQKEGRAFLGRVSPVDRATKELAQHSLQLELKDPQYTEGCRRLLKDLAETEAGKETMAAAWQQHQASPAYQPGQVPPVLPIFAAGVLTGGVVTMGAILAVLAVLRDDDPHIGDSSPQDPGQPASPPPGAPEGSARPAEPAQRPAGAQSAWSIPVTSAEWRAELERRNERFGAPECYWCYVRPGTYRIGGWVRGEEYADLELQPFWVARVPVTVAQYAAFIEAGGYDDRRWWTPNGWKWRQENKRQEPWRWREAPFNSRPRQAVTGIDWYEATAYCAWLSAPLGVALPRGYTVRLPSEAEWEAAAAYDANWRRQTHPWGEQAPTSRYAVFDRKWEDATPDVATCPAGVAACGALDLVGTVWECTAGSYAAYPHRAHWLREDFTVGEGDVPFRGASYYSDSSYVRCGARDGFYPDYVRGLIGFRVIVAPLLARLS